MTARTTSTDTVTRTACGHTIARWELPGGAMFAPLTPCCGAAVTGSVVAGEPCVTCKGCGRVVADAYGRGAGNASELARVLEGLGCKIAAECAEHSAYVLERDAEREG